MEGHHHDTRLPEGTPGACRACLRLRFFVPVSIALIMALYLQPDWAVAVAARAPSPIFLGLGGCVLAACLFVARLARLQSESLKPHQAHDPQDHVLTRRL